MIPAADPAAGDRVVPVHTASDTIAGVMTAGARPPGPVALVAVIFVFWGQPTAGLVIVLVVLLLVVLGLIELTAGPA